MLGLLKVVALYLIPFVEWAGKEVWGFVGAEDSANGGWRLYDEIPIAAAGSCTIQRIDIANLTEEAFFESFVGYFGIADHESGTNFLYLRRFYNENVIPYRDFAYSRPVIIENYKENDGFRSLCEKKRMLSDWGNMPVVLASANTYSYIKTGSTFAHYVDLMKPQQIDSLGNETMYLFGDIDPLLWKPLLDEYRPPPFLLPGYEPAFSFGVAAVGTGVPFHFHGPGFAEIIHGSKRWFLQEFEKQPEFDPDRSTLHWYVNVFEMLPENRQPLHCLLRPGELIYFPDKWWHATLNAETSVFVSTFLSPIVNGQSINTKNEL